MSRLSRPVRWTLFGLASLILLVVGGFGLARALSAGEVLGDVRAGPVRLGGLDRSEASAALQEFEAEREAEPVSFSIGGSEALLEPARVGFDVDEVSTVAAAMEVGRSGDLSEQFRWWLANLFSSTEVPLHASVDSEALDAVLEDWNASHVGEPPFPGAVEVEGTAPVAVYPRTGRQIDPEAAPNLVLEAIVTGMATELPVVVKQPRLSEEDIDRAVEEAKLWLSSPVSLAAEEGGASITFSVEQLASALRSEALEDSIRLSFDPLVVEEVLVASRGSIESEPVDAELVVDGYQVSIVPGRPGTSIDPQATTASLEQAAASSSRRGVLPLAEGVEPEVTTAELEALDIRHMVSSFTTYHDCCQNRVTNIHLFADAVDGAIVRPGETFGLNAHVGERTVEKGYLEDGTIIRGELVETVGGGVSQFATTFYNAVFWGGYEDVTHKPHSFYFSRYPEGIEATISWPLPELEFRNDSASAVLIKTSYTDTSITVMFYGNNDGRILVGAHRSGDTDIDIVADGGPNARRVGAQLSDRYDYREPTVEYRGNPALGVDEQRQAQSPAPGWTVKVTRTIEQQGSTSSREWVVVYQARREIVEVHPCRVPGSSQTCPTTTTTTLPPETTTTPPPAAPPPDEG